MKKALEPFGITDLSKLNFVSDRGSNFVKALKPYSPTYCVCHRLNNIIKKCFYQTCKKKCRFNDSIPNEILELLYSSDSEDDDDNGGEGDIVASLFGYDLSDTELMNIPSYAKNVLKTISSCKALVKFIKKVGIEEQIKIKCPKRA
jgi:hypothetical protein